MQMSGLAARIVEQPRLAALRHRDFRHTWLASVYSVSAMWTFIIAVGWLVFEESQSSAWVGIITFSSMLPSLLVSPIGGLLGDIFDRRSLAMVTFVASAVVVATLAVLVASETALLWQIALLAFVLGVVRNLREPAMQALTPNQVPREDLLNALVLRGASSHGARFLGPLIAYPLLRAGAVGPVAVLALSTVFHLLGAFQMYRTRTVSTGETSSHHGLLRSMVDGLFYIYRHEAIALFILLVAFHCALVMSFESMLPVFSTDELGATDGSIFSLLIMAFGLGAIGGLAVIAGVKSEKGKGQLLMLTGIASGLSPMLLALSGVVPMAVMFAAAMGASQATFMALTNTYVQTMTPDRLRARISSLYMLHAGGVMAFANLGYGFMADLFSAPPIFLTTGALFVLVVVSLGAAQPVLRRVYRTGQVLPA